MEPAIRFRTLEQEAIIFCSDLDSDEFFLCQNVLLKRNMPFFRTNPEPDLNHVNCCPNPNADQWIGQPKDPCRSTAHNLL